MTYALPLEMTSPYEVFLGLSTSRLQTVHIFTQETRGELPYYDTVVSRPASCSYTGTYRYEYYSTYRTRMHDVR